jgi:hypothetical protein
MEHYCHLNGFTFSCRFFLLRFAHKFEINHFRVLVLRFIHSMINTQFWYIFGFVLNGEPSFFFFFLVLSKENHQLFLTAIRLTSLLFFLLPFLFCFREAAMKYGQELVRFPNITLQITYCLSYLSGSFLANKSAGS